MHRGSWGVPVKLSLPQSHCSKGSSAALPHVETEIVVQGEYGVVVPALSIH
jgi:hypothetical protein